MPSNNLLSFKNLSVEFGSGDKYLLAVDNLSFTIHAGQTIGIVGESGSGKSITSLTAMRLLPKAANISSGEIIYSASAEEVDILKLPEKQMRKLRGNKIAMIFQEPMTSLNPVIKCGEQVAEALRLHQNLSSKQAREKTLEWFKEVKLPRPDEMYESYPHQISGGQKQRVMIAMAMCCEPQILIADEPTTALDVTVQKTILDLIKALQEKHRMAVIFITHDLGVVAEIADHVVVMYKGNVVEQGSVDKIFNSPQHPYTQGLLACRPPLNVKLSRLPVVADFMHKNKVGELIKNKVDVRSMLKSLELDPLIEARRKEKLYEQEAILSVKNLKNYFPVYSGIFRKVSNYIKAVDDVSFDIYPGETLGLVGESGCGKTTLGRTILKLLEPTAGEIYFKGKPIHHLSNDQMRPLRKQMQIIFQDPYSSLNPKKTVGEAIMEPMRIHQIVKGKKQGKQKCIELLEKVGLNESVYGKYPHEFSGGQRQRICIARSLALSPEFLICDESVSALDVSVQAQVLNLLNELKAEFGFTYIFISHDMSVVKYMSDRMIVMNQGKIVEMGDADKIFKNPTSEYTRSLIEAIPKGELKINARM